LTLDKYVHYTEWQLWNQTSDKHLYVAGN